MRMIVVCISVMLLQGCMMSSFIKGIPGLNGVRVDPTAKVDQSKIKHTPLPKAKPHPTDVKYSCQGDRIIMKVKR